MAKRELTFDNLRRVLTEYAEAVVETYRRNIVQSDALATETLYNSVDYEIVFGDARIEVDILLAGHWRYSEYDTAPHWSPIQPLKDWVRIKGIEQTDNGIDRAAYAIRWKIHEQGTKGTNDLHNALEECDRIYTDQILDALREDIEGTISAILIEGLAR